jgi:hypothetical protein
MYALGMARKAAFGTFATIFLPERQNTSTMTAPICAHIRKLLEAMRDAMVDLLLVWICFCVRLADTLCNDTGIAFCVTSVLAVFALHSSRILEEIPA